MKRENVPNVFRRFNIQMVEEMAMVENDSAKPARRSINAPARC